MSRTGFLWLRKSIFAKFSLSFISVGLVPLLILSYFSLNTFSSYLERHTINNFEQMLLFAGKNVDDLVHKYNEMTKLMYAYSVDGKYLQLGEAIIDQSFNKDIRLTATVDDFLKNVLYTDTHMKNTMFVFPDGSYQAANKEGKLFDSSYAYPPEEWKQQLYRNRKELAIFPTHPEDYYVGSRNLVMTFGRNLIDIQSTGKRDQDLVGSLYIDVSVSAFDEIFQQLLLNPQDAVYLTDEQGNILYASNKEMIGTTYQGKPSKDYIHLSHPLSRAGWNVVGEVYQDEMFSKIKQIKNTIASVIALCIASLVAVAIWFSRRFSYPIRSIMKQMTLVESGKFDSSVEVRTSDEIGMLARGFNRMTNRLQSYIDEVYVAQIKQKHAELHALKSQIRPHYLYNTLEVIRMSAVANDDNEVADMILSLSHQLKYVLDYGQESVALLEEKANLEQYFRLMQFRYGEHRLAMDLRMEGDVLGCLVPKLSLQPLVENAIYHGIMPKSGKGTIRIIAEKGHAGQLLITVDDDGVGMTADKLELLRGRLSGQVPGDGGGGGIGVKNVHDRIVALYGQEFGIGISSTPLIGTSVRMIIPYMKEVDSDD
ncbi:cache domain-containing sensor histidine kinase [Paenibacillus puerhi]|uniref:cache domain-containing sensor histidine kinase n=1 Tax=Paenibacillus puerhi TaxID=2692622 RepID=UPI0013598647|nr:sensor histidine kinase [Paenibacillus puerhi]